MTSTEIYLWTQHEDGEWACHGPYRNTPQARAVAKAYVGHVLRYCFERCADGESDGEIFWEQVA